MKLYSKYQLLALAIISVLAPAVHAIEGNSKTYGVPKDGINGFGPYMQSIGTTFYDDPTDIERWIKDENGNKVPTVGAIIGFSDDACGNNTAGINNTLFNYKDLDGDLCLTKSENGKSNIHDVKWFIIEAPNNDWTQVKSWDDTKATEITNANYPGAILPPNTSVDFLLKPLDFEKTTKPLSGRYTTALKIPNIAQGKKIGVIYTPASQTGVPYLGKPIKMWDLSCFYAQKPPNELNLSDDNNGECVSKNENGGGGTIQPANNPPKIDNLAIIGNPYINTELTGTYTFVPGKSDKPQDVSSFVWYGSTEQQGTIKTSGKTAPYLLTVADVGKLILLEVTPKDLSGLKGKPVTATQQIPNGDDYVYLRMDWDNITNPIAGTSVTASLAWKEGTGLCSTNDWEYQILNHSADESKWLDASTGALCFEPYFDNALNENIAGLKVGGKSGSYVIEPEDKGKSLFIRVKKKNTNLVFSTPPLLVSSDTPFIKDLAFGQDSLIAGNTISASYTFIPGKNDEDASTFIWDNTLTETTGVVQSKGQVTGYLLSLDDIGKSIKLTVQAKDNAGIEGNTLVLQTDVIKPLTPSVANAKISGNAIVGETLTATYDYKAGITQRPSDKSLYQWLANDATLVEGNVITSKQVPSYTITTDEVGKTIKLKVTAKDEDNNLGNVIEDQLSVPVSRIAPQVDDVKIIALTEFRVGETLTGSYRFVKGTDLVDSSEYTWSGAETTPITKVAVSGVVGSYTIKNQDVGNTITLTVYPKDSSGETGSPKQAMSSAILGIPPKVDNLEIIGDLLPNQTIKGKYDYIPGINTLTGDKTYYVWTSQATQTIISGNVTQSGVTGEYTISNSDVGSFIRLEITAEDEITVNDPNEQGNTLAISTEIKLVRPTVSNVKIQTNGPVSVGNTLQGTYTFTEGIFKGDKSKFIWSSRESLPETVVTESGKVGDYIVEAKDVGATIKLSVTAFDSQGNQGNTATDELSTVVSGKTPVVSNLAIQGSAVPGNELTATYEFTPGESANTEDKSEYIWLGMNSSDAIEKTVTNSGQVEAYNVVVQDVGNIIRLNLRAKDASGIIGNTLSQQINAAYIAPQIKDLEIINPNELKVGAILTGRYNFIKGSGSVDQSVYYWESAKINDYQTISQSGQIGAYTVTANDVGRPIKLTAKAVDDLGTEGNTLIAITTDVKGTAPTISNLEITGIAGPGNTIAGSYQYVPGQSPMTSDESTYSWQGASVVNGTVTTSTKVDGYKVVTADVGKVIKLSVTAKDKFGLQGNTLTANITANNIAPKISNLKISYTRGVNVGDKLAGSYTFIPGTGTQDKTTYQWKGAKTQSIQTVSSTQLIGEYVIKVDDVGSIISLTATAADELGTQGNTLTESTPIVTGRQPTVSNLVIKGTPAPGQLLTGSYTFVAGESPLPSDKSESQWIGTNTLDNNLRIIKTSGIISSYSVINADVGKTITLNLTAKDEFGIVGNKISTSVQGVIIPPSVSDLKINYAAGVRIGDVLSGSYKFTAGSNSNVDESSYTWQGAAELTAKVKTSGIVESYTIKEADLAKVITLSVTAKDAAGQVGNTLKETTAVVTNNKPTVSDVKIYYFAGTKVGDMLGGSYKFTPGIDNTDKSTFTWEGATKTAETINTGSGSVGPYTISFDDTGKVIKLSVTAKDGIGQVGNTAIDTTATVTRDIPMVSNVKIYYFAGTKVGDMLGGSYKFSPGLDKTDKSTFIWEGASKTAASINTGSGSVGPYTIQYEDTGKVIKLSVTAKDAAGKVGNTVTDTTAIVTRDKPMVSNVKIYYFAGSKVGDMLGGSYKFSPGIDKTDKSTFIWEGATKTAESIHTGSGSVGPYTIKFEDTGKVVKLIVTAKDGAGQVGNTAFDTTATVTRDKPMVSDVKIYYFAGTKIGDMLGGSYKFSPGKINVDKSTYVWQGASSTPPVVNTGSANNVGSVGAYKIKPEDAGKTIKLIITANDGQMVGNTAQDTTAKVTGLFDNYNFVVTKTVAPIYDPFYGLIAGKVTGKVTWPNNGYKCNTQDWFYRWYTNGVVMTAPLDTYLQNAGGAKCLPNGLDLGDHMLIPLAQFYSPTNTLVTSKYQYELLYLPTGEILRSNITN